jgi:hypothetical protein
MRRCLLGLSVVLLAACGGGGAGTDEHTGTGKGDDAGTDAGVSFEVGIPCDDKAESLYADPGKLPEEAGTIIRCVDDGVISKEDIAKKLAALKSDTRDNGDGTTDPNGVLNTYQGSEPKGAAHVYRVLYKTQRGNGADSSAVATMYVPETDTPKRLPSLLIAHGAVGQAPTCAPSLQKPGTPVGTDATNALWVIDDLYAMVWPLVGAGFVTAVTDSAGYNNFGAKGNPEPGFADIQDTGRSFLDSGRALRKLVPGGTNDDLLLVGLSQGGHTVLGSLEVSNTYPPPGKILAAAVYSPLWFAQRAWGVSLTSIAASDFGGIVLNKSSGVPGSIWYHYTHAELYDGPGAGVKLFKPEVQAAVKDFVDGTCWSGHYKKLADAAMDENAPASDFFTQEMVDAVGMSALSRSCDDSPNKPLCNKWMDRYRGDHPVLTGNAATIPILMSYGLKDPIIPNGRFKCGVDKLEQGKSPLEFCINPDANHGGIVLLQSDYVNQWLFHKIDGSKITATCPSHEVPADFKCDDFLPND